MPARPAPPIRLATVRDARMASAPPMAIDPDVAAARFLQPLAGLPYRRRGRSLNVMCRLPVPVVAVPHPVPGRRAHHQRAGDRWRDQRIGRRGSGASGARTTMEDCACADTAPAMPSAKAACEPTVARSRADMACLPSAMNDSRSQGSRDRMMAAAAQSVATNRAALGPNSEVSRGACVQGCLMLRSDG